MTPHEAEELERLIHQTLRSQPDRRAPQSLEGRVLSAIAARASLPWWRQSFAQWPVAAKLAFLVIGAAIVKLVLVLSGSAAIDAVSSNVTETVAQPLVWFVQVRALIASCADLFSAILNAIPPLWLYSALAAIAVLYTALFGLGAAAYRTLYVQR